MRTITAFVLLSYWSITVWRRQTAVA